MSYWPFWLVGIGIASVPIVHWFWLRRMFAVSGRYTAIVDAATGATQDDGPAMSKDDLIAALRDATASAFGESAVGVAAPAPVTTSAPPQSLVTHLLFLGGLMGGAALARYLSHASSGMTGGGLEPGFVRFFGSSPAVAIAVFVAGGMLVGFGTRMAGGCTSGHGLCGTSRMQPGSVVATACFFGAGILASFLLGVLR